MGGELYAIGVGPGDPELLTLKGCRLLQRSSCIVACRSKGEERSLALSIANPYLDRSWQQIVVLEVPMGRGGSVTFWEQVADSLEERLGRGERVAFITLGHPLFYGSFLHLLQVLQSRGFNFPLEVIPGISSWGAASAAAQLPLVQGGERMAILPGAVEADEFRGLLKEFQVVILLKVNHGVGRMVRELQGEGLPFRGTLVVRCGLEGERILSDQESWERNLDDYLSLLILERGR